MSKRYLSPLWIAAWAFLATVTSLQAQKSLDEVRVLTEAEKTAIAAAMPKTLPAKARVITIRGRLWQRRSSAA